MLKFDGATENTEPEAPVGVDVHPSIHRTSQDTTLVVLPQKTVCGVSVIKTCLTSLHGTLVR